MSRVLVTGSNGFIGAHLVNRLKQEHSVVSLYHNAIMGRWQKEALEGTRTISCDIRNLDSLRRIISRHQIDQVYHTAAVALVKTAYRDPVSAFSVNAMGTVSLLEACRLLDVEKTLVLNTDKVYGEGLGQTEDKPYVHGEPYQTSKCCQGFIAKSYMDTYGMNIVMPHSCNVFGYDPYSDRIVPNVVKKCLRGGSPLIFTNDDSLREYIYIEDMLDALTRLMEDRELLGSYNISTDWVYNQKDVVLEILKHFPDLEPKYVEGNLPPQIHEQSLKSKRWDFEPSWAFGDALEETIQFFEKYKDDWA